MYIIKKSLQEFVNDPKGTADQVEKNFSNIIGYSASDSEINSWKNSYPKIANVLSKINNKDKFLVYFEFFMPGSSARADLIIIGMNKDNKRVAIIIELKQWDLNNIFIEGKNIKIGSQIHPHPSEQALSYEEYLRDLSQAFSDKDCLIKTYAFLLNSDSNLIQKLKEKPFEELVKISPIFAKNEDATFANELSQYLINPPDQNYINEFEENKIKISKTLFNNAAKTIKENPQWKLLDSQIVAYNLIMEIINKNDGQKHLILVKGDPGTGKSVIAMQIMGELLRKGVPCVHITNSSSFTTVTKSLILERGNKLWGVSSVNGLFKLSHNWVRNGGNFKVAICDEAHRFRRKTTLYPYLISNTPQAQEIINHVDILIAFIDEKQILRKQEEGTIQYFVECAKKVGISDSNVHGPIKLDIQFRCAGNADFVKALDTLLYENKPIKFSNKNFVVNFHDDIEEMESFLNGKIIEGQTARIVAGFCWPWSDPDYDGKLTNDVKIGNWSKPWNAKAKQGQHYNPNNHPYTLWATRKEYQLNEVGCIYSVQGFEFDYIGVIWGEDLIWRSNKWIAQPEKSYDSEMKSIDLNKALQLLRNAYRVLCSRGLKGCSFYIIDKETKEYLKKSLLGS
jgi:hypothetical protein